MSQGTRIGKDGIEETYDKYLRGKDGYTRVILAPAATATTRAARAASPRSRAASCA